MNLTFLLSKLKAVNDEHAERRNKEEKQIIRHISLIRWFRVCVSIHGCSLFIHNACLECMGWFWFQMNIYVDSSCEPYVGEKSHWSVTVLLHLTLQLNKIRSDKWSDNIEVGFNLNSFERGFFYFFLVFFFLNGKFCAFLLSIPWMKIPWKKFDFLSNPSENLITLIIIK